jgi:hypothetical protein
MNVPAYGSEPGKPKTKWIAISSILVLAVFCGLMALIVFVIGPKMLPFLYGGGFEFAADDEPAKSSGPSKTMAEMFEIAQAEAKKIDTDAVLDSLNANTPGYLTGVAYTGPIIGSIEVTFEFRRPTGAYIDVTFEDADPSGTLDVNVDTYESEDADRTWIYKNAQSREGSYIAQLKQYKLSIRDAVAKTWDDAREYARKSGVSEKQVLPFISTGQAKDGNPIWNVDYRYKENRESISLGDIFDLGDEIVEYTVDGLTGEITKADYQTISPTPTTAP